jgi:aryl-alcohol dehydrogenase-like predicted oxidoreductase
MTSRIGLGAMRLTGPSLWGEVADRDGAVRFLSEAVEAGIDLIDTADVYGPHTNELLIRDALWPYANGLVVATKGGFVRGDQGFDSVGAIGNRNYLRQAARLSARRLGVAQIELYYLHSGHAVDAPFGEQIETLVELQHEGVIRRIGLSNVTVEQFREARSIAEIAAVTAHFNLVDRSNLELMRAAESVGTMFVPWQPVSLIPPRDERTDTRGDERVRSIVDPIAAHHAATTSQIALAWLLAYSPAIVTVPGTTSLAHLTENLAAQHIVLEPDEIEALTAIASP